MVKIKGPAIFGVSILGVVGLLLIVNIGIRINDIFDRLVNTVFAPVFNAIGITNEMTQNILVILIIVVILAYILGIGLKKIVNRF